MTESARMEARDQGQSQLCRKFRTLSQKPKNIKININIHTTPLKNYQQLSSLGIYLLFVFLFLILLSETINKFPSQA